MARICGCDPAPPTRAQPRAGEAHWLQRWGGAAVLGANARRRAGHFLELYTPRHPSAAHYMLGAPRKLLANLSAAAALPRRPHGGREQTTGRHRPPKPWRAGANRDAGLCARRGGGLLRAGCAHSRARVFMELRRRRHMGSCLAVMRKSTYSSVGRASDPRCRHEASLGAHGQTCMRTTVLPGAICERLA